MEISKSNDSEFDYNSSEKFINVFNCNQYSSWKKGKIERSHEFIRNIIPMGIIINQLTNKNVTDMMNDINNIKRRNMNFKTSYELFKNIYGEENTKKLHRTHIKSDEVNLNYNLFSTYLSFLCISYILGNYQYKTLDFRISITGRTPL